MEYDLKSIRMPRLMGAKLRLVAELCDAPAAGEPLARSLVRSGGIETMRRANLDEVPAFLPPTWSASAADVSAEAEMPPTQTGPRGECEFAFATIGDYAAAYRCGAVTPDEVAGRVLAALAAGEALDPPLRPLIACDRDDVLAQAAASTARWRAGMPRGPLDGVPLAVKDEFDQTPYPTTAGTRFLGGAPARADSTIVARLRAAGALLIGKANMHELGIAPTGLNPHYGAARNPYDPSRDTGGSSSGSAAIVAAGICPAAIGADGGGSIRVPASFCGAVGLKPSFGRVSEAGDAPLGWSVSHAGPLAAAASDAALVYAAIAGPDASDPRTIGQPAPCLKDIARADLRGLTLGIYRPWFEHASPPVVAACAALLDRLRDLGARVREVVIPDLEIARLAHVVSILSEMAAAMEPFMAARRRDFAPATRVSLAMGRAFTSRDYVQAQRVRARTLAHFERAFQLVDVVVTPATGITAPALAADALEGGELDASQITEIMRFVFAANLTGLPAIAFPAGYDALGLPIGMQVVGRRWEEHVLLRIAGAAERLVPRRRPRVYYPILRQGELSARAGADAARAELAPPRSIVVS